MHVAGMHVSTFPVQTTTCPLAAWCMSPPSSMREQCMTALVCLHAADMDDTNQARRVSQDCLDDIGHGQINRVYCTPYTNLRVEQE